MTFFFLMKCSGLKSMLLCLYRREEIEKKSKCKRIVHTTTTMITIQRNIEQKRSIKSFLIKGLVHLNDKKIL